MKSNNNTKFVFVTGGVTSSLGKGIVVASLGRILKSMGLKVNVIKLDPYLNVDPGTMNPYQHGEVFVTDDGAETDLDLGHYERFINTNLTKSSNLTSGMVYQEILLKERRGDFLGGTVQVVPHVINEIKSKIREAAELLNDGGVLICEVGGTVGDIEGEPFLEAIRQFKKDVGRDNTLYIHLTLVPYLKAAKELKTKPTQHSVKELRSIGIQPDIIILRSEKSINNSIREKISLFCDVEPEAVIPLEDVKYVIYEAPIMLESNKLSRLVTSKLKIEPYVEPQLDSWIRIVEMAKNLKNTVEIAIAGKYVGLPDSYISVVESLRHSSLHLGYELKIRWINTENINSMDDAKRMLEGVKGIVVPGGFGVRGIEGKILAARFARENNIPYFGLCLGMQIMCIEFARNVLGLEGANSTEFDENTKFPVIDLMEEQKSVIDKGATMRLGAFPCKLMDNTLAKRAYNQDLVFERHRHRYEFNNMFKKEFEEHGMIASGIFEEKNLVEIVELRGHRWYLGTQFHPEFKSRPNKPHPLFFDFMKVAISDKS
ncbi:CTP synthase [Thermodesulfobium narugense DSM 14796]|uniref:CTP synthase n=1 Tax=Thermodesulfobium narugense DSM 14796 TaxID=747365 RepID=M1E733_9BACT|nr:CTP synthase [Thermodesulfobium narugense]AEE15111.1 CTP synthase [Thermodesulfobium narugense DSM 14796]